MNHAIRHLTAVAAISLMAVTLVGCQLSGTPGGEPTRTNNIQTKPAQPDSTRQHLEAHASITAHFIEAALNAGYTPDRVNDILAGIAQETIVDEFWISDDQGMIAFTSHPGTDFSFPTDPNASTQAAPFARLLDGSETTVTQEAMPREIDGRNFQYVGVAGTDSSRIVQVGMEVP